ncbi:MAG: phage major tail tube protein [Mariprofundus sp.]|nr:phage major tail tube protein [Mariprofundus sp.]
MKHIPQFITGQTAFIQGIGLLGMVKTVTLPKVEQIRETIKQGGFERSIATGIFKALEAELTLTEYHPVAYQAMQNENALIVIKGSIKQAGKDIPLEVTFKGGVDVDDGVWETGKEAERKVKVFCDYYSLMIGGVLQVEMDRENMIATVMGVDHLEAMRKHIL